MIIVEDRFEEMIEVMPLMKNSQSKNKDIEYKVNFGFGDDKELMNFIVAHKNKTITYPLIWLVMPYKEVHSKKTVKLDRISFILAVETNDKMFNRERFNTTYKNVLVPLYDNFRELLEKANIVNLAEEVEVWKYPNYSNEKLPGNRETLKSSEKNKTFDIWDAIKVTMNIKLTDNCFRKNIKFRANEA